MAKSMKVGGGGRFAKGKAALMKKGMSAKRAGGIMAAAGRKKYGKAKFQKMGAAGRKRASGNPNKRPVQRAIKSYRKKK